MKADLPLYLRLVQANRHDSVSAVVALTEFRDLYPGLKINTFIHDSACDNLATYELLNQWNINAVVALAEKGNFKYPPHISVDDNGVPICSRGYKMVRWGIVLTVTELNIVAPENSVKFLNVLVPMIARPLITGVPFIFTPNGIYDCSLSFPVALTFGNLK